MNKDFLEKLEAKIKKAKRYPADPEWDIGKVKNFMIPLIEKDFIDSVPDEIQEGASINLESRGFETISGYGTDYYIMLIDQKIKLKIWEDTCSLSDGWLTLKELGKQICEEISNDIGKKINFGIKDKQLYFYCFY